MTDEECDAIYERVIKTENKQWRGVPPIRWSHRALIRAGAAVATASAARKELEALRMVAAIAYSAPNKRVRVNSNAMTLAPDLMLTREEDFQTGEIIFSAAVNKEHHHGSTRSDS